MPQKIVGHDSEGVETTLGPFKGLVLEGDYIIEMATNRDLIMLGVDEDGMFYENKNSNFQKFRRVFIQDA